VNFVPVRWGIKDISIWLPREGDSCQIWFILEERLKQDVVISYLQGMKIMTILTIDIPFPRRKVAGSCSSDIV
jgi:hypothetical protein